MRGFFGALAVVGVGVCCLGVLSGCTGVARGVAQAVMEKHEAPREDTRECYVRGRRFEGLAPFLDRAEDLALESGTRAPDLKVLMVHGMGSHLPGYSARLAENLARSLQLDRVQERYKELELHRPEHQDEPVGTLRVSRYLSGDGHRNLLFYELTWSSIVAEEKRNLEFDSSEEYAHRRASVNRALKEFVNTTFPDVLMYSGLSGERIQSAVAQSVCWMMARDWQDLPFSGSEFCDVYKENLLEHLEDKYVFITHSLGSRITVDALQHLAALAHLDSAMQSEQKALRNKKFTVFMLSNQLPLLQLGRPAPEITGQIDEMCRPDGSRRSERQFGELRLVAFSDPNDLFSYALPSWFLDQYIDSRICPTLTNVVLNIAPVTPLWGLGSLANPRAAHVSYDDDSRTLGLIAHGIGGSHTHPEVEERCVWVETIP